MVGLQQEAGSPSWVAADEGLGHRQETETDGAGIDSASGMGGKRTDKKGNGQRAQRSDG